MNQYADIAFATAVRRMFTYRIPPELAAPHTVRPGMRAWVPFKSQMAIGMVMCVHDQTPDFETQPIARMLDQSPVLSEELIQLIDWVSRFYYCSAGEVVQAALPAGMNFMAEARIRLSSAGGEPPQKGLERELFHFLSELSDGDDISLKEIASRWKTPGERAVQRLVARNLVEIWQIPRLRVQPRMQTVWNWRVDVAGDMGRAGVCATIFRCLGIDGKDAAQNTSPQDQAGDTPGIEATNPSTRNHPKWIQALLELADLPLPATRKQILKLAGMNEYAWNRIRATGLLESSEVPADEIRPDLPYEPDAINELNTEQKEVFEPVRKALEARSFRRFLLFGVTGSGKTEVYIHALRQALQQGRGGLILVPEIALTPQTVRRFYRIFGDRIAVLHSRLSDRERYEAWSALQKGEKTVAIGPRSAVFAPVRNPGLIIIDEEHDGSYKQEDPAPRYHARETAVMRAWLSGAVVLTGSATPSLVSLQAASAGKAELLRLDKRHASARLPEVHILDLKQYRGAMRGPLAVPLFMAVEQALSRKEQVILLLNRRGFATYMQCDDCGHVLECPHCSVSLTWHKVKRHLRCHYCGYTSNRPNSCPSCDSHQVAEQGMGTQRIEEELAELFPAARLLRMDQDSTSRKGAHDAILNTFGSGEADILMGTQIVAKGLDFPRVTVVGVINSDTELAFPSYRASERMYQLISQVAGRSGRGERAGQVFLQTLMPDHIALTYAKTHDFPGFARHEMVSRKQLGYPPYSRLAKIYFRSVDEQLTGAVAEVFSAILHRLGPEYPVLGPSPSLIVRTNNIFSWESHIKIPPHKGAGTVQKLFDLVFEHYEREKPKGAGKVRITINVDTMN